ncbi:CD63 antigen [Oopsacas minuta]|uniref:CD63 antigen n=1 Tax=Oopsacas minuta TaxID=111878 RepID=A0AAV7KDH6_9METZ|nr:CD63 antigen [Oopsacas minuta]
MNVQKRFIAYAVILGSILALMILISLILTILTALLGGYAVYWNGPDGDIFSASTLVYFHAMFGFAAIGAYLIIVAFFGYTAIVFRWRDGFIWLVFFCVIIIVGEVGMAVYVYLERTNLVDLLPYIWNFLDDTLRVVLQDQLRCCNFGNVTFGNDTFVPAVSNGSTSCIEGVTITCYPKLTEVLGITVYVVIGFMVVLVLIQLAAATVSILLAQITYAFKKYRKMQANEKAAKTSNARIPRGMQTKADHDPIMQTNY